MLVGMLTFGVSAVKTGNTALKFDDTGKTEGGGTNGMSALEIKELLNPGGFTVSMDFIMGRPGGPCFHPTDLTLKHTSKFVVALGYSENSEKYVGYSATHDFFFLGVCANSPMYGEGSDGIEYLATSETGLVKPGVSYKLDFEFIGDTGINLYLDGEMVLSFDLYDDLDYPTYFAYQYFMFFPTHITCMVDNVAAYAPGAYDPTTGESTADPVLFSDFEDDEMQEITDETGTAVKPVVEGWQFVHDSYTLVDTDNDIYSQPNYDVDEDEAKIVFEDDVDSSTGRDFTVDLTIENNAGLNTLELDLLQDEYITPKSVEAADGLTATLEGTKLTITGDNYTGETLATITYTMDPDVKKVKQDYFYRYGAKASTASLNGESVVVNSGMTQVWNFNLGDINGDGKYNLTDVSLVLKFVAKWDMPQYFRDACDVNGDGRVNGMDASYYLKWVAKWPGYVINGIQYY